MYIGLLQCDDVSPELREEHGNYPEMFARLFASVDPAVSFRVWRCLDGEIPEDTDAVDAWLITGSRFGVNDRLAWIEALSAFVRELWHAGKPLVGVCFGHQLIGKALGGAVAGSPLGWGVGMSFNRVTGRAEWMDPWQASLDLVVHHQDQLHSLPPEATVLAGSDFCPFYLVQVGQHFLGVQGHPEFARPYSRDLMQLRRQQVGEARIEQGLNSLSAPADDRLMARWILNFLRSRVSTETR